MGHIECCCQLLLLFIPNIYTAKVLVWNPCCYWNVRLHVYQQATKPKPFRDKKRMRKKTPSAIAVTCWSTLEQSHSQRYYFSWPHRFSVCLKCPATCFCRFVSKHWSTSGGFGVTTTEMWRDRYIGRLFRLRRISRLDIHFVVNWCSRYKLVFTCRWIMGQNSSLPDLYVSTSLRHADRRIICL